MTDEPLWDEPEQAPPWRPEHGPEPQLTHYPHGHRPMLAALVDGRWRTMLVHSRADYPDGRVAYRGDIHLPDHEQPGYTVSHYRAYWWPQPGRLKVAHPPP